MFQWASDKFDKLSEAVAPPPTDAAGRFSYAVSRQDEDTAMGCIAEIDPVRTVVNQSKGWFPIHMACQYSMVRLIRLLMNQQGVSIQQPDYSGSTPLHHACMSTQRSEGLEVVKILMQDYSADPCAKNSKGQTPYDIATLDSIRQYLLPIQLQRETQYALDNGGVGLAPGIDLGGLRINRGNMAPPPQFGGAGVAAPPPGGASAPMRYPQTPGMAPTFGSPMATPAAPFTNASPQQQPIPNAQPIARAPASMPGRNTVGSRSQSSGSSSTSTSSRHARSGGSSLAIYSKYKADGFHSSSSDVGLQQKYGHVGTHTNSGSGVTPPPSSGNAAPMSGNAVPSGPNPFASGTGNLGGVSRYAAYGPVPAPASGPTYSGMGYAHPAAGVAATQVAPKYFTPGVTTQTQAAPTPTTPGPLASANGLPTSPFMPPPPYFGTSTEAAAATPASATAVHSPFVATATQSHSSSSTSLFESPPKASETVETSKMINEAQTTSSSSAAEVVDSNNKDASSDWVETADPTSGQTYYFNSKTNETSWEKPNSYSTAAADANNGSPSTPSMEAGQDATGGCESDWSETVDPTSGKAYYFNSKTGETSWEKPTAGEAEIANINTTGDNEPSQDAAEWVEATDISTGSTYYYNSGTGETSWERPSALDSEEKSSPPDTSSTTPEATTESTLFTTADADDDPAGRTEEKPEIDQNCYSTDAAIDQSELIQEETNSLVVAEEEVKEESDAVAATAKAEDEAPEGVACPQESNVSETATTTEIKSDESSSNALPDGWVKANDPSSGKVYYCNMKTQETSWKRPVELGNDSSSEADAMPAVEEEVVEISKPEEAVVPNIADGWEELQDPASGKMYYYNKETQETSWEMPTSTTISESVPMNDDASLNRGEKDWVETLDSSSGKNYYYNAKTGETSWEKPTAFKANETQTMDANAAESEPTSAEDTVTQQAAVDTETKPQGTPTAAGHQRTLSAQEMFSSPPGGKSLSNGTPGPSTNFISPASATQGSGFTSEELSKTEGAPSTAEDLFGSKPADFSPTKIPEPTNANDDMAPELTEDDDEGMTDIPLSPEPVSLIKPDSTNTASIPKTKEVAPSPAANNDLFAAIGMPPPPFQSRR